MASPRYLPVILAVLALASLAGAVTLSALHNVDAREAWTAFIGFADTARRPHPRTVSRRGWGRWIVNVHSTTASSAWCAA